DNRFDIADQGAHALGRGMAHRIAHAYSPRARFDCCCIERANSVRARASRIFGHIHYGQAAGGGKLNSVFSRREHHFERPPFGVLANWARSDKSAGFDSNAGPLRYIDYRLNIGADGPGGAIGPYVELAIYDLLSKPGYIGHGARACPRQPYIGGL